MQQETIEKQLHETQYQIDSLLANLLPTAQSDEWEEKLRKIQNRIQRLGPINLTAIDEYQSLSERNTYLEQQNEDLLTALTTLENAIRKIDQETKARFTHALDTVNEKFKTLFPHVFGGGQASLELTEDNLLEAGVLVKAKPPGKRNSSIHLLSGG